MIQGSCQLYWCVDWTRLKCILCIVTTLLWEVAHLNVLPVISLELRSLPPPQFSTKLAFLHKLLKFKFLPQDTLPNIFFPHQVGQIKIVQCDLMASQGGSKCSRGGTLAPWGGWSDSVFNHAATPPNNFLLTRGWALIASIATHMIVAFIITVIGDQKRIYAISEQSGL